MAVDSASASDQGRRVRLVSSGEHVQHTSLLPSNPNRSAKVHALIRALLPEPLFALIQLRPQPATNQQITEFHSKRYLAHLFQEPCSLSFDSPNAKARSTPRPFEEPNNQDKYGTSYDAPRFYGMEAYCRAVAGGSLDAATALVEDECDIAIHWEGGRHHAK